MLQGDVYSEREPGSTKHAEVQILKGFVKEGYGSTLTVNSMEIYFSPILGKQVQSSGNLVPSRTAAVLSWVMSLWLSNYA